METPICVIDAKTFVDHIQIIKHWIYSGHLRLFVPSCTIEEVEQLYQKSIEQKPTTQEAPRPKSLGKPARKEYPAFDINPRVAREYLARLKNRKAQESDSEQRVFFQEKENHEAVYFQKSNEQYTQWKDLDVEEERPEFTEGPPTSWAEALRRKQNLANGVSEKPMPKAPAKPKLVARATGGDMSPWKIKKDAPKISAKDVPGALRPLMSCALWRLHESIERNDANQLFLLSDQTEARSVAQKLNIVVRSCKDFAATVTSKTSKTCLDTFGDLEREFGVQQKSGFYPTKDAVVVREKNGVPENANEDLVKDEDVMSHSTSSDGSAKSDSSSIVHEQGLEKQSFEQGEKKFSVNGDRAGNKVKEQDLTTEAATTLTAQDLSKKPAKSFESIKSLVDNIIQQDFEKHLSESVTGLNPNGVISQSILAYQQASELSATRSPPEISLPHPQNAEPDQHVQEVQTINDTSPSEHTPTHWTSPLEAAQEPEDSDEEIVVFIPQPKRFSAQKKPSQQSSRPSTPKEQSQQKTAGQSPEKSLVKPQPKGKAVGHSPNPSIVSQARPQPVISPTVIDPDAFGRDFRINLNPSPRPPHNPSGHSNHRPRGNVQNSQTGQVPRNSPRQLARASPPRNAPQENSRRLTPIPGPAPKDTPDHRRQASRTSPRRAIAPKIDELAPADVESRALTAAGLSKSQISESRMVDPTEFVSQTAFSTAQLEPNELQSEDIEYSGFVHTSTLANVQSKPKVYEASEFVPRPPRPVREFKPRAPRPKVFEAAEFVPRDFVPRTTMPRTQPKQYSPEPESIEPRPSINDVDYVLKSGSTRASARGRGRLWTPS
ncbi:MAG: hypothetical protein ASARMPRED_002368 [Alectoria sarmentosa]|nr:MAG: hypothetical protein ASARMPRED_002368 [Alectoria sarmentosa]